MPDPKAALAGAVQAAGTWIRVKSLHEAFTFGKKQSRTEGTLESLHHRLRMAGSPSHRIAEERHLIGVLCRNQDLPASWLPQLYPQMQREIEKKIFTAAFKSTSAFAEKKGEEVCKLAYLIQNRSPADGLVLSSQAPEGGRLSQGPWQNEVLGGLSSNQCLWQQLSLPSDCSRTSSISSMMARSARPRWSAL